MSWKRALLPVVCGILTVAIAGPSPAEEKPEEVAAGRAEAWLALVDVGDYGQSWEDAAKIFKQAVTKDQWTAAGKAAREPLGKLKSRKSKSRQYTRTLPGAPEGEYVVIQYDSSFESKVEAVETIIPMKDPDGTWRVSGYFIK